MVLLVLGRHLVHHLAPPELAASPFLLAGAVLEGQKPFDGAVAHRVLPALHQSRGPRVLEGLCLHDDKCAVTASLYHAEHGPVVVGVRLLGIAAIRGRGRCGRHLRGVRDAEGDVGDSAALDGFDRGVIDGEVVARHAGHGGGEDAEEHAYNESANPSPWLGAGLRRSVIARSHALGGSPFVHGRRGRWPSRPTSKPYTPRQRRPTA
jgi:hypothetical protein